MGVVEVERLRGDLAEFAEDVFGSLTRSGWQDRAGWYLHGLMLDGRRKSIQPMAARLDGVVHEQALNHFVTNSPWSVEPVRARIAGLVDEAVAPQAWAIDDTGAAQMRRGLAVRVAAIHRHRGEGHQLPDRGKRQHGHRHRVVSG
jgi:SRSO17 transposase